MTTLAEKLRDIILGCGGLHLGDQWLEEKASEVRKIVMKDLHDTGVEFM